MIRRITIQTSLTRLSPDRGWPTDLQLLFPVGIAAHGLAGPSNQKSAASLPYRPSASELYCNNHDASRSNLDDD
jgi:hypothetical protein